MKGLSPPAPESGMALLEKFWSEYRAFVLPGKNVLLLVITRVTDTAVTPSLTLGD